MADLLHEAGRHLELAEETRHAADGLAAVDLHERDPFDDLTTLEHIEGHTGSGRNELIVRVKLKDLIERRTR